MGWIERQLDQKWVNLSENFRINADQQGKIDQLIKPGKVYRSLTSSKKLIASNTKIF